MATASKDENILHFAGFDLDLDGPEPRLDGRVVPLRPKSLALISHLAQRPGQLVRKDELVDAVWGTTAVTDATLARTLFDAREALGDETGEFLGRAEVLRVRGDLALAAPSGGRSDRAAKRAQAFYREAVEFARRQEATRLELQSALDLARLWQGRSRDDETVALLTPILERLPHDVDSPEILEARSFLPA